VSEHFKSILYVSDLISFSGTFVPYSPLTDINGPDVDGFSAGTGVDGSAVYVGYGDNSACGGQVRVIKKKICDVVILFFRIHVLEESQQVPPELEREL
jgi:hypothetical protein